MNVRIYRMPLLLCLAIAALLATPAFSQSSKPTIVLAGHEHWKPVHGWIKGDMITVLSGHPREHGEYLVREKIPPNMISPVMYHPMAENNTVLAGTFYIGFGDKADPAKAIALPAGSFVYIPAGVHHYAITKSDGALIETRADGPGGRTIVSGK